jgi:predicted metal-binding protein
MVVSRKKLSALLKAQGYDDFQWLDPRQIVVAQWVRQKCMFGCPEYGHNAACPPNTPSVDECARFFREYRHAAVLHFSRKVAKPGDRHAWTRKINRGLLKLEREVFIAGHRKAFALFMDSCGLCKSCSDTRAGCKNLAGARPAPEAMAVDVFTTVRRAGFDIEVLADYDQTLNRFSLLMVE